MKTIRSNRFYFKLNWRRDEQNKLNTVAHVAAVVTDIIDFLLQSLFFNRLKKIRVHALDTALNYPTTDDKMQPMTTIDLNFITSNRCGYYTQVRIPSSMNYFKRRLYQ